MSSSFGPDTLWSYEIGAKNPLLEKKLAIQASVYYIDWIHIQAYGILDVRLGVLDRGFDVSAYMP